MVAGNLKTKIGELKMAHWFSITASMLIFIGFCFVITGLAGTWWSGSWDQVSVQYTVSVTLWKAKTEVEGGGMSADKEQDLDEGCDMDGLTDEVESRCKKLIAVRVFIFFALFTLLPAVFCSLCASASFIVYPIQQSVINKLIMVSCCSAGITSIWALIAVIVAATLEWDDLSEDVGLSGAGAICTILLMVMCCWPSVVLEILYLRQNSGAATTSVVESLPTLIKPRMTSPTNEKKIGQSAPGVIGKSNALTSDPSAVKSNTADLQDV